MISVVEKGLWVLGILLLVSVGAAFAYLGAPPTVSRLEVVSTKISSGNLENRLGDAAKKEFRRIITTPAPKRADGKPARAQRAPQMEVYEVNRAAFYLIKNRPTALNEAQKVSSEIVENEDGTNSLKLTSFGNSSLLGDVGMKEGDVVDTINGKKIDFSSELDARALYESAVASMEAGNPIVIDIRRRNKPMRVVVAGNWNLKKLKSKR